MTLYVPKERRHFEPRYILYIMLEFFMSYYVNSIELKFEFVLTLFTFPLSNQQIFDLIDFKSLKQRM